MIKILKSDNIYRRDEEFIDLIFWDCTKISTGSATWKWNRNMLQHYYIIYVSEGNISCEVNSKNIDLDSGSLLLISPNMILQSKTNNNISSTIYVIEFDCNDFPFFDFSSNYLSVKLSASATNLFYQLNFQTIHNKKNNYYYESLLILIFDEIKKHIATEPDKQIMYDNVCHYISDNISEDLTVEKISEAMNYNKDYLCRIIKNCNGSSLQQLIIDEKLNLAQNLLKLTNYSCEKIATHIGCSSGNSFVKFFKYHTSETPTAYRIKNGRNN